MFCWSQASAFSAIQRQIEVEDNLPALLPVDPQGKPVESLAPATSEAERDVRPRSSLGVSQNRFFVGCGDAGKISCIKKRGRRRIASCFDHKRSPAARRLLPAIKRKMTR
ncbi:MAG: hypothetical protein WKF30_12475 [Pyrinomonadaceae bacterium]